MTLAIQQLSDIHIQEANDPVLERSEKIAAALNPYLADADAVVILISGDIAQAGTKKEYTAPRP